MNYFLFVKLGLVILTFSLISGCYRMPTDEDYSLVPVTNNPSITCEKPSALPGMPAVGY